MNAKLKELWEIVELTKKCRASQRAYFKDRHPTTLREAKDAERRLDAALVELAGGKAPTLFSDPDGAA